MSRLPFELFLALRYLRPKRTFVSVITLISAMGVMLGVAVLIIVISVMTGFDRQLRDKILGFSAHLKIFRYEQEPLPDYEAVERLVQANRQVRAVAPFILGQVMIKTQPQSGKPMVSAPHLRGIDLEREPQVSTITTSLISGDLTLDAEDLLMGSELARHLHVQVGDHLAIYSPRNLEEMEKHKGKENEVAILPDDFVVRGIFDVGYYEYNANVIVSSLRSAQDLYQLPGKVHGLLVMLTDPYLAPVVRGQLQRVLGPDYRITMWTEENSQILTALAVEKNVMFYLLIFIVIVAAFGIMNSQITFVVQKTREIGMLRALGATGRQIRWLFLSQSLIIGIIGVSSGFVLGRLLLAYRNEFLHFMNRMTGLELFPAEIYAFTELPALIVGTDILFICGSALVICVLAGFVPAWTASRLKPVEALRHE
ncbi:MAG TPA: ABC transporter permease [Verrucomicrobiae bacterium]|jgi:lipoprotein-releasing system permease protein|nr:ABC transporter permease [Verrucomicrobiae bacterium]